jgi:hypothetical protein
MVQPAGRVTTTTLAAPDATGVAHVPAVPDVNVTVGAAGTVKPELNVTEMVLVATRAPAAELWKPTVQVEMALAAVEPGEKVTPEDAPIRTGEAGLAGVVSWEVITLKVLAG